MDAVDKDAFDKVGQKAEGRILEWQDESHIKPDLLKTFQHDSLSQFIKTVTHEFSAVCPFSGLPDLATVIIEYRPQLGMAVELKSLKYYLLSFRNVGIYQEAVTKKIFDHFKKAICYNPAAGWKDYKEFEEAYIDRIWDFHMYDLRVTTHYHVRGGFYTTCVEGSIEQVPQIEYPDNF